jgi:hypothetical protein
MAALQENLTVNLDANRSGNTTKFINESLSLANIDFDEATSQVVEVPDAAVDQAVNLAGLTTIQTLLVISDRALSYKLNGASVALAFKNLLVTDASLTALSLSNASGGMATVRVYMLGT